MLGRIFVCRQIMSLRSYSTVVPSTGTKPKVIHLRPSVDPVEVEHFSQLVNEWMDENGSLKALHSFNRIRVPWILDELKKQKSSVNDDAVPLQGLRILDVGCGSGILSFPLIRLGAQVDGLDVVQGCVDAGTSIADRILPEKLRSSARFVCSSVEQFAAEQENIEAYDAIVASEVIEHVPNPNLFIRSCHRLLKPRSAIFFSTINRTFLSQVVAVELAEGLNLTPKGTHDWNKFVTPHELRSLLLDNNFQVAYDRGLFYDPLVNEWAWFVVNQVNYALLARKP
ncbi:Ubiquinone biosynthesis O-methyltransferase, mitochondrial [Aphelenchoides besseyi]|nr:Ubiquinone biosynthesis O-methyltransferase, mitochondrial [Aphelenchoides besseyi]